MWGVYAGGRYALVLPGARTFRTGRAFERSTVNDRANSVGDVVEPSSDAVRAPCFSVVIPLYNKARHVEEAIRSVLAQTFSSFEIIVVNDASTDGSREIVEAMASPRVRLLDRTTPGPGGYAARNLGTAVAVGEWITYLDADDTWNEDRLEQLQAAIRQFPDANVHACAWFVAHRNAAMHKNKFARIQGDRGRHRVTLVEYFVSLRKNRPVIHTDTVAIRRSSLPDGAVFPADVGLRRGGDVYAWLRLMCRERCLVWSPHAGANYFVDSDNMVTRTVAVDLAALAPPLIQALEEGLSARERGLLRRAANGLMWAGWLREVLQGRPGFRLRRHLFWRGAYGQALAMTLASLVPQEAIRGLRRVAKFSSSGG